MNIDSMIRTPFHTMPIALVYASIDRKVWRDQYCIECGHPFIAISDKYISIQDGGLAIDTLRSGDKVLEARCKDSRCKQRYRVWT